MFHQVTEKSNTVTSNSEVSRNFLETYDLFAKEKISAERSRSRDKTISPSAACMRQNWFRLRGSEPDTIDTPDLTLDFMTTIGTACHEMIQKNLQAGLKEDWVDVSEYIKSQNFPYDIQCSQHGMETRLTVPEFHLKCACDGIVKINDTYYLLEIKTSDYVSFSRLEGIKDKHRLQVSIYSAVLNLPNVLMLYVDRTYGSMKCFQYYISPEQRTSTLNSLRNLIDLAEKCLPPDKLPYSSPQCASNMCPYYKKCKEW